MTYTDTNTDRETLTSIPEIVIPGQAPATHGLVELPEDGGIRLVLFRTEFSPAGSSYMRNSLKFADFDSALLYAGLRARELAKEGIAIKNKNFKAPQPNRHIETGNPATQTFGW